MTARRIGIFVALGLAAFWVMAVSVSPRLGVTADEVVHLTGGYSYWKFNDYRLHPENGTLAMRVATLPLLGMELAFPSFDDPDWLQSRAHMAGRTFFFDLGNPVDRMLQFSRAMIALFGVATVWLIWTWSRRLFGPTAGWLSLGLAIFCPALLAHSGLATSDIALTACVLFALSATWRALHRVTVINIALAALACGAAFLAKMSGVLIVPVIAGMLAIRWMRKTPLITRWRGQSRWWRSRGQIVVGATATTFAIAVGSLVVLWAAYGFRYSAFNDEKSRNEGLSLSWDVVLEQSSMPTLDPEPLDVLLERLPPPRPTSMTRLIGTLRDLRVLPEAYLWGFAHTYKFSRERAAFLDGEYSRTGWRSFFPKAFWYKTPLPTLTLITAGIAALCAARGRSTRRRIQYRMTPLLLFLVLYAIMAINMNLNIGHRHILPIYPVLYILAGAAVLWAKRVRWGKLAGGALLGLLAIDSAAARPFYLSYFHPLAGGIDRGYEHLVDSSFDWGQGLPDFADWLREKAARGDQAPVFLSYFGADSPRARGLDAIRLADDLSDHGPRAYPAQLRGGWYAIGATQYQRVYLPVRGPWTQRHEELYADLRAQLRAFGARPPENETEHARLVAIARAIEILQFGRLMHTLGDRRPEELIGGSILLFRLSDEEVGRALYAPVHEIIGQSPAQP